MRKVLLIGAAVLAVLIGIGVIAESRDGDEPTVDAGALQAAMATAGCQPVVKVDLPDVPPKHLAGTVPYADVPPNNGNHSPNTLRNFKRFYSREDNPAPEQAVHNLEHGLVIAWYDTELPDDQVAALEAASQDMGSRYMAVPWNRTPFPGDRHFVLTAWGRSQRCRSVSPVVIKAFVEQHADSDDAPEKGYNV